MQSAQLIPARSAPSVMLVEVSAYAGASLPRLYHHDADLVIQEARLIPTVALRPGCMLVVVQGDSMDNGSENAIRNGDAVLVDTRWLRDHGMQYGRIYVFTQPDGAMFVKRWGLVRGRRGLLSDNPAVAPVMDWRARGIEPVGRAYAVVESSEGVRYLT